MTKLLNLYKNCLIPTNLSFDEESLFWRLRMGEGVPEREWHKPLDRTKSWQQIKLSLDKKLQIKKTNSLFFKTYASRNFLSQWIEKFIRNIKIAFLFID